MHEANTVIGWVCSVFNDYDFGENPFGFRPRTVRALPASRRRISKLASSLFLARDRADMQFLVRGRRDG